MGGIDQGEVTARNREANEQLPMQFDLGRARYRQRNDRRSKLRSLAHRAGIVGAEGSSLVADHHLRHHGAVMSPAAPAAKRNRWRRECGQGRSKENPECDQQERVGN